jgi:hypothetical protein
MTTKIEQYDFRTPSGKMLRTSRQVVAANVERLAAEADAWYARNQHVLKGYSVAEFLEEKHRDVEEGLL